ncbi:MAG: YIP1 family protein [Gemmatimonadaceae bacterium]|nr:YIP1 family protein [Gemmatimonadaceae bacterium]NUO93221.1 YIP1 family protein [Gemmatimonadaceae bacterium]NUP55469.1 YIP1 family protein [Gemmatimonadaceae bacterium]NUP71684.1 YIP1 family protein [Gemmatimonadaceae bacterium]
MADLSTSDRSGAPVGTAPSPEAARASWWEDFIDIFYAPSQVYARRAGSGFGIPMLVVTLLITALAFANSGVMQPIMDAEFARSSAAAMRQNPQLTPEMMAKGRAFGEGIAKYGTIIFMPVGMFLTGLLLWLVGKIFDARESLAAAIMVAAYAFVPRILEGVLAGVQGLLLDPSSLNGRFKLSLGLGRFLDPDTASPVLLALLGRVDVFTIWVTVLLAIGLSVTGRIPRSRAAMAAAIVWLCGAIPQLMGALRS